MKSKRIILSMVSTLLFLATFIGQSVLAAENGVETGTWTFTEINAVSFPDSIATSNPEFALGDGQSDYDGNPENNSWKITQIGNATGSREYNMYCARAGVGFENRSIEGAEKYKDTYTTQYDMLKAKNTLRYYDEATHSYKGIFNNMYNDGSNVTMYTMTADGETKYNQVLALADLFYLGSSEEELKEYLEPIVNKWVDEDYGYYSEFTDNATYDYLKQRGYLIDANQIRAVQQAALWYFTNGKDYTDKVNNDNVDFLYYRTSNTSYQSLAGLGGAGSVQDYQAKQLYKYFISKAQENAANESYVYTNTVHLYLDNTTDDEQPILEVIPGVKEFDLALRKYITKVGNQNITDRIPNVETENTLDADATTASYQHRKDPEPVKQGDKVIYTITVYNEGDLAGKATKIVDQLPAGVKFLKTETESLSGDNYTFAYDETTNKVTITAKDSLENLDAYTGNGEVANTSVQVVCEVTAVPDTDNEKILTNLAWISEAYNASKDETYSGNEIEFDRDSAPGAHPEKNADTLVSTDENDYKGKNSNKNVKPADSNYHYEGQQDDDDFEKIVIKPEKMDLALRKFITKIGSQNITDRIPQISEDGKAFEDEETTAMKEHKKDKLGVVKGDTVVYTIRIYNEGTVDGYAKEVTDYLPEGLTLKTNSEINTTYGWKAEGQKITTDYLADKMLTAANRDYTKFNANDAENKYYRDLKIECIVNENATSNNLKNIAEITDAEDKNGNKADEDSNTGNVTTNPSEYNPQNPTEGRGEQDDDDFEDLKIEKMDLALRKFITKIGTQNITDRIPQISQDGKSFEDEKTTAMKEHKKDKLEVTLGDTVVYTIRVYNEGKVDGYASIVTDYLPAGLTLKANSEINNTYGWEAEGQKIKTSYLADKMLTAANRDYAKFNANDAENKYYRDLKIECVVNDNATSKNLKNIAEITESQDKNGNKEDEDSDAGNVTTNPNDYNPKNPTEGRGEQDDDDFEDLKLGKFDLALRKFITKIGNEDVTDRIPQVSEDGKAFEDENTTAMKEHKKDKLGVAEGEKVVYTIRVYNEGYVDGYASIVTDYLPEGLTLVSKEESTINTTYGWEAEGQKITTDYLADKMLTAVNKDFTKFNDADAENKYYRDLKIECIVNENATSENMKNIAEITESKNKNGKDVPDEDSTPDNVTTNPDEYNPQNPTEGRGEQDDDDFEELKLQKFDLALRKYIVKVENKNGEVKQSNEDLAERNPNEDDKIDLSTIPDTAAYKHRKDPVVVKTGDIVYYNLTVYNEGDIEGYATKITDKLPSGTEFVEVENAEASKYELESNNDGVLVLKRKEAYKDEKLAVYEEGNTTLDSDTVTIKCKVVAEKEEEKDKIYTNIAWISEDYNDKNAKDRDSKPTEYPKEDTLVTDYDKIGYIGDEEENKDKDLTDKDEYFKGEQDDDDFEKIIIYKEPEVHKGVKDVKNQDSGYDANVEHEWVINSSLPLDIKDYKTYTIIDDIDYRLVYGKVTEVNIIDKNGRKLATLEEGEDKDYIVEYKANTSSDKYSGTLKLRFIDEDKEISNTIIEEAGNIIEVKFATTFATDEDGNILAEIIGKQIPNKARLEYENGAGDKGKKETEQPEVHTGGITLYKYTTKDGEKVALEDAEFEIFRNKEDALTRETEIKEEKEESKVEALQTAKSGKDGLVKFVGLEYGEDAMDDEKNLKADGTYIQGTEANRVNPATKYWIVETKAPKGYKTITEPIEVEINNDTYKDEVEVLIREEESKETTNRLIENTPLNFDLALRKFITQRNDKAVTTRVPQVKYEDGKITYDHTKDPVKVVNADVVTYTLRIFNEGQIDGFAQIITDDIPEGLEFLPEHNTNKEYRWVMYEELKTGTEVEDESKVVECKINGSSEVKKYIETKDASKAVIIRTDYLSKEQGETKMEENDKVNPNLLKAFNPDEEISQTNPDNRDIKAAFRVIEPNGSKRTLINYAQISEDADENGDDIDDIDSTPDIWNDGEDDQDIEKLIVPEFDLALRKWVTQAIVIEDGKETVTETGHDAWDDPEEIVKVELHRKKLSNVTVKFRYSIRVYNQGEIAGYAKEVTDYIPQGLKFVAEDNPSWTDEGNNVISTRALENTLLQPGESADVEVLLTWINGNDNLGLKTNIAEISEDYNDEGVPDKDSTPDNQKPGEDDIDDAPVMLSVSTGTEVTFIILGTIILVVLAGGVFLIKKYVL